MEVGMESEWESEPPCHFHFTEEYLEEGDNYGLSGAFNYMMFLSLTVELNLQIVGPILKWMYTTTQLTYDEADRRLRKSILRGICAGLPGGHGCNPFLWFEYCGMHCLKSLPPQCRGGDTDAVGAAIRDLPFAILVPRGMLPSGPPQCLQHPWQRGVRRGRARGVGLLQKGVGGCAPKVLGGCSFLSVTIIFPVDI